VHDRNEELVKIGEIRRAGFRELSEESLECEQVSVVFIGFESSLLHFLLELGEGSGVGRLVVL
jgi:hypothetical protein